MKMLNAWTLELDDPAIAVAEILEQLDLEHQLLEYAAGFITCSYDYVETGMVEAICKALPFDVVGCTTLTNANNHESGAMLLSLSVLTADDCRFHTALTPPLEEDFDKVILETYGNATGNRPSPGLVLAFLPNISAVGGEQILQSIDQAAQGVPVFGSIACDFDTANFGHSFTIYNGQCLRESIAFLLISGNINPRFVVLSTSEQNLHKQQAMITASDGNVLLEVNGMSVRDYLASIGLTEGIEAMTSVPFVVNYNDGTQPVARAMYTLNEDGSAVCGGKMPVGGTLSIGRMDVEDILRTAEQALQKLLAEGETAAVLMFPCLGRNMVLGTDPLIEVEKIKEVLGDVLPWHLAYSLGEVCPVYDGKGCAVNRFHNFTFIACAI